MNREDLLANAQSYQVPEYSRADKVRLDMNENLWGPPFAFKRFIKSLDPKLISMYPEYASLYRQAAKAFALPEENILLTNGADEAIRLVAEAWLRPGDKLLLPVPTFSIYPLTAALHGAYVQEVPFEPDFAFPLRGLLQELNAKVRLVVLINPNNPTGTLVRNREIKAILDNAPSALVLVDETYAAFSGRSHNALLAKYPRLMVVGSFSKFFAMAGLRLGYLLTSSERIALLKKIIVPYPVNAVAAAAAEAALTNLASARRASKAMQVQKTKLVACLRDLGLRVFPGAANFLLVNVGPHAELIQNRLLAKKILVKHFPQDERLREYLRITIGRWQQSKLFLSSLATALPPEAVVFDMDGVLIDVSDSYCRAIKKTVAYFSGREVAQVEIERWRGKPGFNCDWDLTMAILRQRRIKVARELVIERFQLFLHGKNDDGLFGKERWLIDNRILARLARHYRLGIVTGRPEKEARSSLLRWRKENFFFTLVTREDTGARAKPHPFGLQLAIKRLGVKRAAYVGDIADDMRCALAAKAIPVAALWQCTVAKRQESLRQAGARFFLQRPENLLEVFP